MIAEVLGIGRRQRILSLGTQLLVVILLGGLMNRTKTFCTRAAMTAALAFTFGTGVAIAQDAAPPPPAPSTQPDPNMAPNAASDTPAASDAPMRHQPRGAANMAPMSDADFAKEAAQGGMAEVKMGKLAEQNGSSDSVKNFGKRMVDDHSKAGEALKAAATQSNIDLPMGLTPKDQAMYDKLARLSGTEFDQAYARYMVRDHVHDVAAFRQESTGGKDDNIKQFATHTLPTLQDHLKAAHAMANDVGVQPRNGAMGARHNAAGSSSDPGATAAPATPQQ
jgi:putative membrane protein